MLGGPLVRNKTFFFAMQWHTEASPLTSTRTVPTLLQRQGDFSQTRNAAGQVMTIYNPFDTFVNAQGNIERRPFPGNVIPASMLDPIALALAYFPLPNVPSTSITETNNWFGQGIREHQPPDEHQDGSQLLGAQPLERPLQLWSLHDDAAEPLRRTGSGVSPQQRPDLRQRPFLRDRVHQDTESDSALERALRVDLRALHRDPMESFDLTQLGLPQHEGSGDLRRVPEVRARRLQPDRHRRLAQDGSPGGRPPLLGLLHQDDGRTQPEGGRRDPVELPRLRSARISLGQFTFGRGSPAGIVSPARATRATALPRC